MKHRSTSLKCIAAGAALFLAQSAANADIVFSGTFSAAAGGYGTVSGSFAGTFDDSVFDPLGPPVQQFFNQTTLTSFSMTPNPLAAGATTWDTSNVRFDVTYLGGNLAGIELGALPVGFYATGTEDFYVNISPFNGGTPVGNWGFSTQAAGGTFDTDPNRTATLVITTAAVPEPASLALVGLALVGLVGARRHANRRAG